MWEQIDTGIYESMDRNWRIVNPWRSTTELRHRWIVAHRSPDGVGWVPHLPDHDTIQAAKSYVADRSSAAGSRLGADGAA